MNKASVFVADKKTPTPGEIFYENLCNPKVVRENLKKPLKQVGLLESQFFNRMSLEDMNFIQTAKKYI